MVLNRTALYIAGWVGLALYAVRNGNWDLRF